MSPRKEKSSHERIIKKRRGKKKKRDRKHRTRQIWLTRKLFFLFCFVGLGVMNVDQMDCKGDILHNILELRFASFALAPFCGC